MLYLENSMNRPNTPRPGQTPRPGLLNNGYNENNGYNGRPPFYISPVSPLLTPTTPPPTPATPRTPPPTPATPLGDRYIMVMNEAKGNRIPLPEKNYLIKGKHLLTKDQRAILDKMKYTKITDLDKYEFITEGYYYPYKSTHNDVAGFLFTTVKKLENERKKINGQQGIVKTYYTKRSAITPNHFHANIPTAKLIDVDKFPQFESGVIYDPAYPDEPFDEFNEFVDIETSRIENFLESKLYGGRRLSKRGKRQLKKRKRKTQRRA